MKYYEVAGPTGYERFSSREEAFARARQIVKGCDWTTVKLMETATNWGEEDRILKTEFVDK